MVRQPYNVWKSAYDKYVAGKRGTYALRLFLREFLEAGYGEKKALNWIRIYSEFDGGEIIGPQIKFF